jgi:dTDP-glucose 4,6-dehydratase
LRLLVTGGAGFIGSNFARHILKTYKTYRVDVLDALTYAGNLDNLAEIASSDRFTFTHGNILDSDLVKKIASESDAIINFAAESHNDRSILAPGITVRTNVEGVFTLLQAAHTASHGKFLHISTDEVYGTFTSGSFKERDALEPNSPYSASKAGGELLARAFHETYGLNTLVTRGSNTYGPYQYPEKLIPLFVTNLIDNIPVPVYGDGKQIRDWFFVEDHCRAIDFVLHHGKSGEIYNVGGGNERENIQIVHSILAQLGKPEHLIHYVEDRPGHDRRYSLSTDKMKALGFVPDSDFDARLTQTVDWYVANQKWWRTIKETGDYKSFMLHWYKNRK